MSTTSPTTVVATERRRQTRGVECMEIEKVYGHGNYGVVYKAVDTSSDKRVQVALKKIKMDRESQGFPITALREIKILNQMTHKNVVKLIEIVTCHSSEEEARNRGFKDKGIFPGDVFMVFEFVDYDLAGLLKSKHNFNPTLIRSYTHQLLSGVKYLHESRYLHRDLKCANILVTSNNVLKIADWGLARILPPQAHKLTVPVVTLWYRSPELILANRNYGAEIDVWSVGCIFMELFTRDPLFQGAVENVQLDKILSVFGCPEGALLEKYKSYPDWAKLNFQGFNYKSRAKELYGSKMVNDLAFDLFLKLVDLDPATRITAKDALEHPYFKSEPLPDPEKFPHISIEPTTEHLENERKKRDAHEAKTGQHQHHHHHHSSNNPHGASQQHHASEQVEKAGYTTYNNVGHSRINHSMQRAADPKLSLFNIRKPGANAGGPPANSAQSAADQSQPPAAQPATQQQAQPPAAPHNGDSNEKAAPAASSNTSNQHHHHHHHHNNNIAAPANQHNPPLRQNPTAEHSDAPQPQPNIPFNINNPDPHRNVNPHHRGGGYNGQQGFGGPPMHMGGNNNNSNAPRQFYGGREGYNNAQHGPSGNMHRDFGNNNNNNNFQQPPHFGGSNPRYSQYFPGNNNNNGAAAVINAPPALNTSMPFQLQPEPHGNQRNPFLPNNGPDPKRSRMN